MKLFSKKEQDESVKKYTVGRADGEEIVAEFKAAKNFTDLYKVLTRRDLDINFVRDLSMFRMKPFSPLEDGLLCVNAGSFDGTLWVPEDPEHARKEGMRGRVYAGYEHFTFYGVQKGYLQNLRVTFNHPRSEFEFRDGLFMNKKLYYQK